MLRRSDGITQWPGLLLRRSDGSSSDSDRALCGKDGKSVVLSHWTLSGRWLIKQTSACCIGASACVYRVRPRRHQVLSHLDVMALVCATLLVLSSLCALVLVLACLLQVATVCHALAPGNRRVLWLSSRSRFGLLGGLCVLATGLSQPGSPAMVECRRHPGHTPFCSNLCVDVGLGMNLLSPLCQIKA